MGHMRRRILPNADRDEVRTSDEEKDVCMGHMRRRILLRNSDLLGVRPREGAARGKGRLQCVCVCVCVCVLACVSCNGEGARSEKSVP
jgi:hypothetical protein